MKTLKIGVFGSADGVGSKPAILRKLGEQLARERVIVITGACPGVPFEVAVAVKKKGARVWGFAPATNFARFAQEYGDAPSANRSFYDKLVYIPKDYVFANNRQACKKYRNVTSTMTCDAGIIVSGRIGTLNEFTNLADFGKVIGVLRGSGGVADMISEIQARLRKKNGSRVVFHSDPGALVALVLAECAKDRAPVSYT